MLQTHSSEVNFTIASKQVLTKHTMSNSWITFHLMKYKCIPWELENAVMISLFASAITNEINSDVRMYSSWYQHFISSFLVCCLASEALPCGLGVFNTDKISCLTC